jgi:hypothetical protein
MVFDSIVTQHCSRWRVMRYARLGLDATETAKEVHILESGRIASRALVPHSSRERPSDHSPPLSNTSSAP